MAKRMPQLLALLNQGPTCAAKHGSLAIKAVRGLGLPHVHSSQVLEYSLHELYSTTISTMKSGGK